ncbi:tRNA glutamyl-Q(34) synthetase GluQRS [Wenzhouxiangella sediminis]|uniref:Glutamyl-Q tRNA(Asp) synthetase n=1 Tax=Wenzhouxiangella sediminis TaxID=1792836 RepID=A0A3E1KBB9_9GAMM|nr:tRNA glutamyl-Q(34) synthetase GluQRS [Wenzhouxiangella sediminis]RFF31908.1 tRNA glutamyl-Q(34) synthetase GluQRS [Wenzhouxiangella sediminis]
MTAPDGAPPAYIGRFAPSPTGALHFGSLVAAVGSYLRARSLRGRWLVRIEDLDPPREVPGAAEEQVETLAAFGLVPDAPVAYQSRSAALHQKALQQLLDSGAAYWCGCSRRDLPDDGIYPGTCRHGLPPGREPRSVRMRTDNAEIECFVDAVQGEYCDHPGRMGGDFIILRGDGLIAYQLAVVVDDAASAITEVVRGADLIDSTPRQLLVYRRLGLKPPDWMHLPIVTDDNGRKLSKSDDDDPVIARPRAEALRLALRALGHEPPAGARWLDTQMNWALANFDIARIPRGPVAVGVHPL